MARRKVGRGRVLWTLDKYHHDDYIRVFRRNGLSVVAKHDAGSALQRLSMNGHLTVDILVTGLYMSHGKNPQVQAYMYQFASMYRRKEGAKIFVEMARDMSEVPIFALGVFGVRSREAKEIRDAGADRYFNLHQTSHHYLLDQIIDEIEAQKEKKKR